MSKLTRKEQLELLKASRSGDVSRSKTFKQEAPKKLYQTVQEDEYKQIVNDRLDQPDFIVDDDGSGYVDNGMDDWDREPGQDDTDDEEEKARIEAEKRKKVAYMPKAAANGKPKKPPKAPVVPSANPYMKKEVSAAQEDDFMANLLDDIGSTSSSAIKPRQSSGFAQRKRKSALPSALSASLSTNLHASTSSDWGTDTSFTADEGDMSMDHPVKRARASSPDFGKFPSLNSQDDLPMDQSMDIDDAPIIAKAEEIDDDDIFVKPAVSRPTAAKPYKRTLVNSSAVKAEPTSASYETKVDVKDVKDQRKTKETNWQAAMAALDVVEATPTSEVAEIEDDSEMSARKLRTGKKAKAEPINPAQFDIKAFEEDDSLRFYWLDYEETDLGVLKFIGKVFDKEKKQYISCCLTVEGIERNIFVLPRANTLDDDGEETDEAPSIEEVEAEFTRLAKKHGISNIMQRDVTRKYAFDFEDVPREGTWLKAVCGFDEPKLPRDLSGKTFSRVMGTSTSAFELFVLKRKIMGPCWLKVEEATISREASSWCKLEVTTDNPKGVNPFSDQDEEAPREAPPLTIMSMSIRTIMNNDLQKREVVCVATRLWKDANIDSTDPIEKQPSTLTTLVRPLLNFPPGFEKYAADKRHVIAVKYERMLLNRLLVLIQQNDPDIIVGCDLLSDSLNVLAHRMKEEKADNWSRLSRFRRTGQVPLKSFKNPQLLAGRLVCDLTSESSKGIIPSVTWSLTEMCESIIKFQREDIDPDDTYTYFDFTSTSPDKLIRFIDHCAADAFFQMSIAFKVQLLPLTKQLTNLAGNAWGATLVGGRAERNESILLHEFHKQKYICPDKIPRWEKKEAAKTTAQKKGKKGKPDLENDDEENGGGQQNATSKKKDKYKGGLVFEPKRGLWDKHILVMDFNSLYPSIIREYNIDFTTVKRFGLQVGDEEQIPEVPEPGEEGVLPRLITQLVKRRQIVKSLMAKGKKDPQYTQWNIKQQALKLTANSMYGCLGFEGSRFYARPLAALTTSKGREILMRTRTFAEENFKLDVIYGDTDSVMINTNETDYAAAIAIGRKFGEEINGMYKMLEIDIDAVFSRMLLLQKKKYAALKVDSSGKTETEIKGLDMKRREYCALAKRASGQVLDYVLSGEPTDIVVENIHEYLTKLGEEIRADKIDMDEFIIFKRLGKNPEDFPKSQNQPHVKVALALKAKGQKAKAGDVMAYIFCMNKSGESARSAQAENAFHPDDVRRTPELKIDYGYYLSAQILPMVERLSDSIDGTDRMRLAECLGLDMTQYRNHNNAGPETDRDFKTLDSQISDAERFAACDPFQLTCIHCDSKMPFKGLYDEQTWTMTSYGITCPKEGCLKPLPVPSIAVQLELQARAAISKFYEAWLICNEQSCAKRTRQMGMVGRKCLREGCHGAMHYEYSDTKLYNQLLYFDSLFDVEKAKNRAVGSGRYDDINTKCSQVGPVFEDIRKSIQKYLNKCGRRYVSMQSLFAFMQV